MGKDKLSILFGISFMLVLGGLSNAAAVPTSVDHSDGPDCDPLFVPFDVDELGVGFPPDELIGAADLPPFGPACPPTDNTQVPDALVEITNLSVPPRSFVDVWYVGDEETFLSNDDGGVSPAAAMLPGFAFKIDNDLCDPLGVNHPLVFESMTPDCIFEPGETWQFIIQDYSNSLGILPSAIDSIGITSLSPGTPSSGSIIAIPEVPRDTPVGGLGIPIDTTALLIASAQSISLWMIPVVLSGIGIGVFVIKRRN